MMHQHHSKIGITDEHFFVDLVAVGEGVAVEKEIADPTFHPNRAALTIPNSGPSDKRVRPR